MTIVETEIGKMANDRSDSPRLSVPLSCRIPIGRAGSPAALVHSENLENSGGWLCVLLLHRRALPELHSDLQFLGPRVERAGLS